MTTTREKIAAAFRQIRKEGGVARMNFMCCSSCGWAELAEKYGEDSDRTMVFWNQQADDAFYTDRGWGSVGSLYAGDLKYGLCLQWQGDKEQIAKAFKDNDVVAITPADESRTFTVYNDWKQAALDMADEVERQTKWAGLLYKETDDLRKKLEKAERKLKRAEVS